MLLHSESIQSDIKERCKQPYNMSIKIKVHWRHGYPRGSQQSLKGFKEVIYMIKLVLRELGQ